MKYLSKLCLLLVIVFCLPFAAIACNSDDSDSSSSKDSSALVDAQAAQATPTSTVAASKTKLDIPKLTYMGHASVKLVTTQGTVIYIDPWAGSKSDYAENADIILITHYHPDHGNMDYIQPFIQNGCKMILPDQAVQGNTYINEAYKDIKIRAVPAYNNNHKKEECVGYILEFDGMKFYHAGDTSKTVEMNDLAKENLTYALLPMDIVYNMGPEEASEVAKIIKSKYVIPIHTGPDGVYSEENINAFKAEGKTVLKPGDNIDLNP